jgi:hypothetical protein
MTGQRRRRRCAEGGWASYTVIRSTGRAAYQSLVGVASGWGMGAKCGRAGGGRREGVRKRGRAGWEAVGGRRWAWTERRGEGRPWGSVLLAPCYSLRAASCLLFGAWAWFTGLLWLCQDSRSVPIASRPASIQLRGPSKSRDGSGSGGKGPR